MSCAFTIYLNGGFMQVNTRFMFIYWEDIGESWRIGIMKLLALPKKMGIWKNCTWNHLRRNNSWHLRGPCWTKGRMDIGKGTSFTRKTHENPLFWGSQIEDTTSHVVVLKWDTAAEVTRPVLATQTSWQLGVRKDPHGLHRWQHRWFTKNILIHCLHAHQMQILHDVTWWPGRSFPRNLHLKSFHRWFSP